MGASRKFRQVAQHEKRTGGNQTIGYDYAAPQAIRVRWFVENELVRNDDGQEITTAARISTLAPIWLGDRITDSHDRTYTVMQVRTARDTSGRFSHYQAWLA